MAKKAAAKTGKITIGGPNKYQITPQGLVPIGGIPAGEFPNPEELLKGAGLPPVPAHPILPVTGIPQAAPQPIIINGRPARPAPPARVYHATFDPVPPARSSARRRAEDLRNNLVTLVIQLHACTVILTDCEALLKSDPVAVDEFAREEVSCPEARAVIDGMTKALEKVKPKA